MALCINDIYELKSMKKMTLLAGMGGIMNPVCSVGIADYEFADSFLEATNDDAQAFEKDSLVISSLLFAEHNPDAILPAIKFLHHTGTAGFAFKTVVYNTLPQEVLDYANAHNYPIFRFGRDLMFEDVIFEVFEAVNRDDKENLSFQNLEGMIAHRLSSDEVHTIAKNLRLQENRVSWSEEKREPTVRYVRVCQLVCTCHGRAKTLRNLIQGQSALFQEKEQKSREIMAILH